ncbi:hypothetical protein B7494_g8036 [Chlorociboria aeruginascens]|nr:hypothetical protein B7494_g8036 [Chlorociboria aeruginascens]
MTTPSPACCKTAPIQSKTQYEPIGMYTTIAGIKTYVTGPSTSTSAVLLIYDIFGYYPQTLRGADILSTFPTADNSGIRVYMPDWFDGDVADIANYPADTPEKEKYILAFFKKQANPERNIEKVGKWMMAVKEDEAKGIEKWGVAGYCWGGKIVSMISGEGTEFKAAAQCHPSLMEAKDADDVTIPMMILPSMDEDAQVMKDFENRLKGDKYSETFGDQVHGWMASKADFEDARKTEEFHRGYKLLGDWFTKYL